MVWDFWLDLVSFLWFEGLLGAPVENSLGLFFTLSEPVGNPLGMPQL